MDKTWYMHVYAGSIWAILIPASVAIRKKNGIYLPSFMGMTIVNMYFDRENTQNHCDHLRYQHGHKMVPSGYLT
jgi:hypothetical protein